MARATPPGRLGAGVPGPRMPESVLRRRPAEVVTTPRPQAATARQTDTTAGRQTDTTAGRRAETADGRRAETATTRRAGAATAGQTEAPAARREVATRPRRLPAPPPAPARPPGRTRLPAPPPVRGRRPVPLGLLAVILVFGGLFTVGAGVGAATGFDVSELFKGPDKPPPRAFPVLEPSEPRRLTIPSIKVEAPILHVGRAKDGSVDVPPVARHNEAGWFDEGPTPGQFGPALIVGHADTRTGPSVFHHLGKLKPGQRIEVLREDNRVAIFQVNSVEHFGKEKLPIKRVYGDYSRPSLRLVTCGGTWLGEGRGYSDNIVVFAALTGTRKR